MQQSLKFVSTIFWPQVTYPALGCLGEHTTFEAYAKTCCVSVAEAFEAQPV